MKRTEIIVDLCRKSKDYQTESYLKTNLESEVRVIICEEFNKFSFKKLKLRDITINLDESGGVAYDIFIDIYYKKTWKRKRNKEELRQEIQKRLEKKLNKHVFLTVRVYLSPKK